MMNFKEIFKPEHAQKLELVLINTAEALGVKNYRIEWLENELNLYQNNILCGGFDFRLNPLTGSIIAELKPPQDLTGVVFERGN